MDEERLYATFHAYNEDDARCLAHAQDMLRAITDYLRIVKMSEKHGPETLPTSDVYQRAIDYLADALPANTVW